MAEEIRKLSERVKQNSRTPSSGAAGTQPSQRAPSAGPSTAADSTTAVVVKGFPYPMWRKKLIEFGKAACATRVPSTVEYKAIGNTQLVKMEFPSNATARGFIVASRGAPPEVQIGSRAEKLKVQWDRDRDTRARGWFLSQLWSEIEKDHSQGRGQDWLRASAVRGELMADIDDTGRVYTLFKYEGDSDTPKPNYANLEKVGIDSSKAKLMISGVLSSRRSR